MVYRSFMALRILFLLILALAHVASSSVWDSGAHWRLAHFTATGNNAQDTHKTCNGLVGDCIEEDDEMMMDSEVSRRGLAAARRYISYAALKKNQVPCNRRGASYYNCQRRGKVNPYRRACTIITRCARMLK